MMAHQCKCGGNKGKISLLRCRPIYCADILQLGRAYKNHSLQTESLYPSLAGIAPVGFRTPDHKLLDRATSLERGSKPTRLLAPPGPSFRWFIRISIFWKHRRIFAPLASDIFRSPTRQLRRRQFFFITKLCQSLFEFTLLGRQSDGQDLADFLVQLPHLINRHGIQIRLLAHPQPSEGDSMCPYINVAYRLSSVKSAFGGKDRF